MTNPWMHRHLTDYYVKKSQQDGYPSRSAYKLLEIQQRDAIIKPGMKVVDLGSAPGGWSMVAKKLVGDKGLVIALDCLPMAPLKGVIFIQGDFQEQAVLDELLQQVNQQPIDVVISDMAPNLSGQKSVDQPKSIELVELAYDFAKQVLKPGGTFLAKIFQGEGIEALVATIKKDFKQVKHRKPKASRSESREIYILATGFCGI